MGSKASISESVAVANVAMATLGTEYSYLIPKGTEKITFKLRDTGATLQFCFTTGETNTTFVTVPASGSYTLEGIKFRGKTLYFESDTNTQVLEVLVYQ